MRDWSFVDWLTVIGTILTLVGLAIAIIQIRKTTRSAEAAKTAAEAARAGMRANVILADLGQCTAIVDELRVLVQANRYDAALLRAQDLTKSLIQLREIFRQHGRTYDFRPIVTDAGIVRGLIGRKLRDGRTRFDREDVLRTLAEWSDELHGLVGEATYGAPEERT